MLALTCRHRTSSLSDSSEATRGLARQNTRFVAFITRIIRMLGHGHCNGFLDAGLILEDSTWNAKPVRCEQECPTSRYVHDAFMLTRSLESRELVMTYNFLKLTQVNHILTVRIT